MVTRSVNCGIIKLNLHQEKGVLKPISKVNPPHPSSQFEKSIRKGVLKTLSKVISLRPVDVDGHQVSELRHHRIKHAPTHLRLNVFTQVFSRPVSLESCHPKVSKTRFSSFISGVLKPRFCKANSPTNPTTYPSLLLLLYQVDGFVGEST